MSIYLDCSIYSILLQFPFICLGIVIGDCLDWIVAIDFNFRLIVLQRMRFLL